MPIAFGNQVESPGQYVTITKNTSIVPSHGSTAMVSSVMLNLEMPLAT